MLPKQLLESNWLTGPSWLKTLDDLPTTVLPEEAVKKSEENAEDSEQKSEEITDWNEIMEKESSALVLSVPTSSGTGPCQKPSIVRSGIVQKVR